MNNNLARDVGNAAEHDVAAQLCRRGLEVSLPRGNAQRTDLVASDGNGFSRVVEVKATQQLTNPTWTVPSIDCGWNGVWVLVHYVDENFYDHHPVASYMPKRARFYVLTNEEMRDLWDSNVGRSGGVRYSKKRMSQHLERWNKVIECDRFDGVKGRTPKQRRADEENKKAMEQGWEYANRQGRKKNGDLRKDWDANRLRATAMKARNRYLSTNRHSVD